MKLGDSLTFCYYKNNYSVVMPSAKFSDFLEKRFCLWPVIFSASKPFEYSACFTHNQMFSFGRSWSASSWCGDTHDPLLGKPYD